MCQGMYETNDVWLSINNNFVIAKYINLLLKNFTWDCVNVLKPVSQIILPELKSHYYHW